MNRANHILLGWAETRNTNVIDPATNEDAYAQIIYMPGSSYPIQDKDVTLYAVWAQNSGTLMEDITIAVRNDGKVPSEPAI